MKKSINNFIRKHSHQITSLALAAAVIATNFICWGKAYQEELPDEIDKLRKFK